MWNRGVVLVAVCIYALADGGQKEWMFYKHRFISPDGRVIDRRNHDITHSEGIGYAMYLSIKHHDRATFDRIYRWMHKNLKRNEKGLSGWLWGKDRNNKWHQLDLNNATDGDLWIAYALLKAYLWTKKELFLQEAKRRMEAIRTHLIYRLHGRLFLLPGIKGFVKKEGIVLNPSYLLLKIYDTFAHYDRADIWRQLYRDAIWLLKKGRFGPLRLHPDWLMLRHDGTIALARNASYGYDALRVPSNILDAPLSKAQKSDLLEGYRRLIEMMKVGRLKIGVIDLRQRVLSYADYSMAFASVYRKVADFFKIESVEWKRGREDENDYYGYSIHLLVR